MKDDPNPAEVRVGFFHVRENESFGSTGGLLIVTVDGRPVEFHCTEPIRTNRAQEILYGPTLRSYVVGDRIGGALLERCETGIDLLICTDSDEASAAARAGLPSVIVSGDSTQPDLEGLKPELSAAARRLSSSVGLAEPFERIRLAIDEAQQIHGAGGADEAAAA